MTRQLLWHCADRAQVQQSTQLGVHSLGVPIIHSDTWPPAWLCHASGHIPAECEYSPETWLLVLPNMSSDVDR